MIFMLENWFFVLAVIAVLMIPGPTNALLASSAHQQGIAKTSAFIPTEFFGYFYAINFWALVIHLSSPVWPYFMDLLHFLSMVYVFWLAFHLWKRTHLEKHNQAFKSIRPAQLFFSTLKNPKALLFAAGIFPTTTWDSTTNFLLIFGILGLIIIPTAFVWMVFGRAILSGKINKIKADLLYKGSAMMLMVCMIPVLIRFFV